MNARHPGAALAIAALVAAGPLARADDAEPVTVLRGAKLVTVDGEDRVINDGVLVVSGGRIQQLGPASEVEIPKGARVIDARGKWIVPGLVDAHNHTAGSLSDLNDGVWLTNPGLRTLDTLSPENNDLKDALAGGVTTVLLIPGSGNNMSGFGTVTRTAGATAEAMALRSPGSLKIAQAGNPERYWFGVGRSYMNWNLRQTLEKARAYHERWCAWEAKVEQVGAEEAGPPPERNLTWEGFRGLFTGEFPVSVHTQMYQVVLKTITMLNDRFKVRVILDHSTFDAFRLAPLIVERNMFTIVGPRQYYYDRSERRIYGCAAQYQDAGVERIGINTDAPVVPEEELPLQAALGVRFGLDPYRALKALTIIPAQALGVDTLVGSLEVGKAADFGVWTGDPIDPRSACVMTFVAGDRVYDAKKKRRF